MLCYAHMFVCMFLAICNFLSASIVRNLCLFYMFIGATSSVQITPSGLDLAVENPSRKCMPSNLPVDIIDNYKEAVINYSKVCHCSYR